MIVVRFKNSSDHEHLLKKVRKMKEFTEELEECLEEAMEDADYEYRGGSYRRDYDEDDMRHYEKMNSRYGYRRGRM